jgi:mono/diheme cytochrome c family protein
MANCSSSSFWRAFFLVSAAAIPWVDDATAADALVARGQYLARAADCVSCHTAANGKPYAGGDELKTPFGSIYGPNITPDPKTGIGTWTKTDFERALRLGVGKDGKDLYPAMPYQNYTLLTDADIDALWAFERSLPPVVHEVHANTFRFPFNIRTGLVAWQSLYFKPGRFQAVADKDAEWNRGNYLVNALGHCNQCHTPRNIAQASETKYQLTGGQIEGWYAPDISSDPLSELKHYSVDSLAKFLKTGQTAHNTKTFGPMQEVVHGSLSYLTDADLHAMALYLKDQSDHVHSQTVAQASISPAQLEAGKALYEDNCSSCHQSNGKGMPGQVPALAGNTAVTAPEPYNVIMAMLQGFAPQGSWGAMGSFAHLSDEQIADIADYVRVAWGNNADPNATLWAVGNWRANAELPAGGQQPALICASLSPQVLDPALKQGPEALREAALSRAKLREVVSNYRSAVPNSNVAQTIEALSVAYCRAIVSDKVSSAQSGAKVANFSQQVAIALTGG